MVFRHFAVHRPPTLVAELFADGPFEESFAALAADGAIVPTGSSIATHQAQLDTHAVQRGQVL